jgi:asparagine synthase (glutamine-hydrolysing)
VEVVRTVTGGASPSPPSMTVVDRAPTRQKVRVAFGPCRTWARAGGSHAVGAAFRGHDLLPAESLARLVETTDPDGLPALLRELHGSFAVIKETRGAVYAAVDVIRSIPLFCVSDGATRIVTDDPLRACAGVRSSASDWHTRAELLATNCVSGPDTLLDDVRQVETGSVVRVPAPPDVVESARWFAFGFGAGTEHPQPAHLLDHAVAVHTAAVQRTVRLADGALIAIPLSAGLDSGMLATLLAQEGLDRDQILTYTFGRPGNHESEGSRRVAEALGLRWELVPYSDETWHELSAGPWWHDYLAWGSSLTGVAGFNDLPAVLQLRERGLLPDDSVVVPGHSLDFLAGSHIPGSLLRRTRGTRAAAVDAVLATYFKYRSDETIGRLLGRTPRAVHEALRARAELSVDPASGTLPRAELVALVDRWGWKERQAKMIVNGVRVYEVAGVRWSLPWWDRDVIDFWAGVPLRQRVGERLRHDLAQRIGWPLAARTPLARVQARGEQCVRMLTLDGAAKKLRNLARRSTRASRFRNDELACFALFGEQRSADSYHGTETPRAILAEDLLHALDEAAARV